MTWVQALGPILGGLGALLGAFNGRQARGHRRRLEALEGQHRAAPPPFTTGRLDRRGREIQRPGPDAR